MDDEPGSLLTLKTLLNRYCTEIEVIAISGHPPEAIELIRKHNPDLVFLDIEMPYANAFDMLDMLQPVKFEVVFVTAFNNYALKAFKYAAVDYLLKPLNIDDLIGAVARVRRFIPPSPVLNNRVGGLLQNLKRPADEPEKISLPTGNGFDVISIENIVYIEASGSYSQLFISDGRRMVVTKSLKEFEELMPMHKFMRIHHSFIVNMQHVKKYYKGRGGFVQMSNGAEIEVAVRKKQDFLARFRPV